MKLRQTIEEILREENVSSAIEFLQKKNNTAGDDGVRLHDLEEYWSINKETILTSIQTGSYEPQIVHEKIIVQANGKHRKISLFSSLDRLLLRILQQSLQLIVDAESSRYSFAYQIGKGIVEAVKCAASFIECGKEYVVELDIKDFFEYINHDRLLHILRNKVEDARVYDLLKKYIECSVESDFQLTKKKCEIMQGSAISPLLSNLYLQEFDSWMEEQGYSFVRFADNINIYISNPQEGNHVLETVSQKLGEYKLQINENKKGIYPACSRIYLGYCFEKKNNQVLVRKFQKIAQNRYHKWHTSVIEKIDQNYHIVNQGVLSRRDYTLLFENEEKKVYIPMEVAESINIYSNVELSNRILEELSKRNLNLNIYNKYGVYQGSFYSARQRNRMKCLLKQVECYQDTKKRLEYAKKMDIASLHNLRCNLRYYQKKKSSINLKEYIEEISSYIKEMNEANNVEQVLLIEARSRQKYYQSWNIIINDENFLYTQRSKRPPRDELNAMISFGNVYLYQRFAHIIHKSQMDIRISFVHSAMKRYENLNLDMADIFKPVIVDRVIFRMIHKRMISADEHFQKDDCGGTFLNEQGKRIMLEALEWKLKQVVTVDGKPYTYERLLSREVQNLEQSLIEGKKYKAFKYQM